MISLKLPYKKFLRRRIIKSKRIRFFDMRLHQHNGGTIDLVRVYEPRYFNKQHVLKHSKIIFLFVLSNSLFKVFGSTQA
ncbi:hypothetical protein MYVALT_G_02580 [Candidatus Vallotia tarda]|uniref:Uncharacterized protein n=1 Tax=Candidatus Vallotiella hemipterorum TaxID=1177213 RepID=A0A916JRV0_9BURK|nr:hypothetical protein MYVALT_G_02580 [Candidatus Vallotia tarda]